MGTSRIIIALACIAGVVTGLGLGLAFLAAVLMSGHTP